VAVRDPRTGEWRREHQAVGKKVLGGIAFLPSGSLKVNFGAPEVGQKICFDNDIMTTPVIRIGRPTRHTVEIYPRLATG
jgi:hypothetical protein